MMAVLRFRYEPIPLAAMYFGGQSVLTTQEIMANFYPDRAGEPATFKTGSYGVDSQASFIIRDLLAHGNPGTVAPQAAGQFGPGLVLDLKQVGPDAFAMTARVLTPYTVETGGFRFGDVFSDPFRAITAVSTFGTSELIFGATDLIAGNEAAEQFANVGSRTYVTVGLAATGAGVANLVGGVGGAVASAAVTKGGGMILPNSKARPAGAGASASSAQTLPTASPAALQSAVALVPVAEQAPSPAPLLAGGLLLVAGVAALLWPRKVLTALAA
jgi:hypothetical protein